MTSPRHLGPGHYSDVPHQHRDVRTGPLQLDKRCLALLPILPCDRQRNDAGILHDHPDAGAELLDKVNVTVVLAQTKQLRAQVRIQL